MFAAAVVLCILYQNESSLEYEISCVQNCTSLCASINHQIFHNFSLCHIFAIDRGRLNGILVLMFPFFSFLQLKSTRQNRYIVTQVQNSSLNWNIWTIFTIFCRLCSRLSFSSATTVWVCRSSIKKYFAKVLLLPTVLFLCFWIFMLRFATFAVYFTFEFYKLTESCIWINLHVINTRCHRV